MVYKTLQHFRTSLHSPQTARASCPNHLYACHFEHIDTCNGFPDWYHHNIYKIWFCGSVSIPCLKKTQNRAWTVPKPKNLTMQLITLYWLHLIYQEKFHSKSWGWNCLTFDIIHLQVPRCCFLGVQHRWQTPQFRIFCIKSIKAQVDNGGFERNSLVSNRNRWSLGSSTNELRWAAFRKFATERLTNSASHLARLWSKAFISSHKSKWRYHDIKIQYPSISTNNRHLPTSKYLPRDHRTCIHCWLDASWHAWTLIPASPFNLMISHTCHVKPQSQGRPHFSSGVARRRFDAGWPGKWM